MEKGEDDAAAMGLDPKGFFEVMGLASEIDIDQRAGGSAFANGA